ncbi:PREDICTED: uncharacterized protein LOC106125758 isoform X1 [Papilio xuthus]|uniref:Uncharacterized protein LOC106125758 isoform X1 n=1 Tax=Papilio xuthus TaxID=66420 RepID=A0AAJ6ZT32_PAPXU|nr:PREDICTED: uncharacterized protein LOC106125758 isoform X1 [Papilio xuthus]
MVLNATMASNPLNELKRRLDDDTTPLPKRLRLAKNVIHSDHFPAAPKERIVAEWLESITERNGLASKDIRHVISWLQFADELTNDLKCRLIKVVSHYLHSNPLNNEDIHFIINFLENDKISLSLQNQIDDYLFIIITLLQNLRNEVGKNILIQKLFTNLCKYYKECKKKLKFIVKFLDGENLETIFSYLDSDYRNAVLNVCQNILFPITKKTFFVNFLQHIIKNDNIDNFIADKSENVQSVIKILSAFFMFPKGRTGKDQKFLIDFVDTFVTCYHNEGQILFAFYIMAISSLNIRQNYLNPEMIIPSITFKENDDKIKRNIFFKMLITLLENEVDISIKLTYTIGEKNKVEMKKNFMSFLQATMLGCLKLEHKTDKISLQIIKAAIKLDPSMIEQKLDVILPPIMTAKKSSNAKEAYIEMFNCLIEILYKLSRGTVFIEKILPNIKLKLEALNVEQFELRQKLKDATDDVEKIKNKIITGEDILPQECVEMYGKLTSELMFRQNSGLLTSLQKDLEENCLMMLEEGFVSPSIIILTEVLSAILSSFFKYSKMADHTVPQQIAEEFWSSFQTFGKECLKKFGECILKLNYNSPLLLSFLKLCLSYSQLKLLNLKYGNIKMEETIDTTEMTDCSIVLPCFNGNQWMTLAQMIQEDESVIWDNLLLVKLMYSQVLKLKNSEIENETDISKAHVIKHLSEYSEVITSDSYITRELFTNLDITQAKQIAKSLVKLFLNGNNCDIFKNVAISNNRILLNAIVLETCKCIMKCFDNSNTFTKAMNKSSFDIESFLQNLNVKEYFNELKIIENEEETIIKHVDSLKELPIYNLEENFRLTAIFVLLAIKKCCQTKKLRRSIDNILLSSYELSPKYPDLYKIFPVDFVFSFQDSTILNLLKLSLKTSNNMLIIKFILELTVKKVKTNSEILKELVEILLSKQYSNDSTQTIEYFSNTVFQIQCIILPIIAKEKRAITSSAFRTILANLQEKLHQAMLESFMHIDFTKIDNFNETDNIDDSLVTSDRGVATLNAIGAYSLTLLKYCEMTDVEELKKLDCLWSGLEFFVQNAIKAIENPNSKYQHIESSIQLLNIALRYIKKLESHKIFERKDDLFKLIWHSIKNRLLIIFDNSSKKRINTFLLEIIAVNIKFLTELSSVDCFVTQFLGDISNLANLKKPTLILKDEAMTNLQLTSHQTSKYLLQHCLKANLIGNKCVGVTKQIYQICKNLKHWIQIYFESDVHIDKQDRRNNIEMNDDSEVNLTDVKIDDAICNLLRIDLDMLSEVILAAKKTTLDYKFIDMIFELQHLIQYILGRNTLHTRCQITWQSFFILHEGSVTVLNNLLLSREELLEDRWPCFMQCYKVLIQCFCERVKSLEQSDRSLEQKLAETAHSIEKLTQSICKRKAHVSRIAAYAVADICIWIEKNGPPKLVRQHLENSIALLIQASDSTYAMAFLRRSLAGSVGQMTMSNMYSMYKRYHKYVGNS